MASVRALREVLAAVDNATSRYHRSEIDDAMVAALLRSEAAELTEAITEYQQAGAHDRVADLRERLQIIACYLPAPDLVNRPQDPQPRDGHALRG